jgi:hypothetical protein
MLFIKPFFLVRAYRYIFGKEPFKNFVNNKESKGLRNLVEETIVVPNNINIMLTLWLL